MGLNRDIKVARKELEISGIQDVRLKYKQTGSTTLKEWTTPDSRNTPSTANHEEEEIVDAPGNDDNASMPEKVKRPNPWRKQIFIYCKVTLHVSGVTAPIIRSTKNCNRNLRYRS